jgi:hypothetical protein
VGAVDCDAHKKLCDDYGVTSHPTLKVIPPNAFGIQDYTGERNTKAVFSWAVRFMTHFVEKVNADNLDGFLNAQVTIFFVPLSLSLSLRLSCSPISLSLPTYLYSLPTPPHHHHSHPHPAPHLISPSLLSPSCLSLALCLCM